MSVSLASSIKEKTPNFLKASEIPEYCTKLVEALDKQSVFDGTGSIAKICKILPLDSFYEARICEIFTKNTRFWVGDDGIWPIYSFGQANDNFCDSQGNHISQGITLWVTHENKKCPLEKLQVAYHSVFNEMSNGWLPATIESNTGIFFKKNSKDFALFIKNKKLSREDYLINFIARKLGIFEHIICEDTWFEIPGGPCGAYHNGNRIYLWIRKSELENVVQKLGLNLDPAKI